VEYQVLDHAHIEEEFRGNGLFKLMLEKTLSALKIDGEECALLVYAFPLQYSCKDLDVGSEAFKRDCEKLNRLYEELGFLKLLEDKEGAILIHNTGMHLRAKNTNHKGVDR
jgi:GNAT superfamily N-acetyltransferase